MNQPRQIALGPALAAAAALLLLVSLFLDWYEPGFSAWTVFEVLDLLLAALALSSLGLAAQALGVGVPGARIPGGALLPVAVVALVIVVSQVIQHPPGAVDRGAEIGIWLALAAVLLLTAGAALGSSYVSVVRVGQADQPPAAGTAPGQAGTPPSAGTPPARTPPSAGTPPAASTPPPAGTPLRAPGEEDAPTRPMPRSDPERPA